MTGTHTPGAAGRRSPASVTVLTGFLGAGKTTLLNHILSAEHGLRTGVLVNDFGAVNIDAKLIVGVEGETVSLANGCVCCTIRDDLAIEVVRLLSRPDPPDHIVVETSGVSDPKRIVQTFVGSELEAVARVDSIIAVVDTAQLLELRPQDLALALDQIAAADLVLLNKVDLVSRTRLETVRARVADIVPQARLLSAVHAQVPAELVLGVGEFAADRLTGDATDLSRADRARGDGVGSTDHLAAYTAWNWTSRQPVSLPAFRSVIGSLPTSVYRAKGLLQLQDFPQYSVGFQLVGRRSSLSATGLWGDTEPRSDLVIIGSGDGPDLNDLLRDRLDQCTLDRTGDARSVDWRMNLINEVRGA